MNKDQIRDRFIKIADEYKEKQMTGSKMFKIIVATLRDEYNYEYDVGERRG